MVQEALGSLAGWAECWVVDVWLANVLTGMTLDAFQQDDSCMGKGEGGSIWVGEK